MGKIQNYVEKIRTHCPVLEIASAEFNPKGQYNDVLIVNESLVFRFAKVRPAIETLRQEVFILGHLQDRISVPIPNPTYINIESDEIGEVFVGYPMIPGKSLWRDEFRKITSPDARKRMATQLAMFLKELHQDEIAEIFSELPNSDNLQIWVEMYREIQEKLYAFMRLDARKQVTAHFEKYLNHPERYTFEPRLRHGDFGTGNILFNPDSLSISGIVDFGFAGVGDPAGDFAGLFISYGEEFYRMCYSIYPEMEIALDRVKFYCGTFALQEALFGFDNDDQDAFRAGMEGYV